MVVLAIDPQRPIRSASAVTIDGLDRRTRLTAFGNDQLSADLVSHLRGWAVWVLRRTRKTSSNSSSATYPRGLRQPLP